jgi:lauroyl/myristoyl acyltransferase
MQNVLQTRWRIDCEKRRSSRGNIDVHRLLGDWFGDAEWQRELSQIPARQRRVMLSEIGRDMFLDNIGNYAKELRWNMELVDWVWTDEQRRSLALDHARLLFASLSDSIDFASGTYPQTELDVSGAEHVLGPGEAGRGVILVSVFQTHPGYAFVCSPLRDRKIGVIRKAPGGGASLTLDGLPKSVAELPASTAAVRPLLKLLNEGSVTAAYCDYVYQGSGMIEAPMFGAWVSVSRSLLKIARQTNAAIVPMAVARDLDISKELVRVEFFPDLTDGDSRSFQLSDLSLRLGIALECLIRRYPVQWRLWNTLRDRLN